MYRWRDRAENGILADCPDFVYILGGALILSRAPDYSYPSAAKIHIFKTQFATAPLENRSVFFTTFITYRKNAVIVRVSKNDFRNLCHFFFSAFADSKQNMFSQGTGRNQEYTTHASALWFNPFACP